MKTKSKTKFTAGTETNPFSRRGFLQKTAIVTGAFITGVLRLDNVFADEEAANAGPPYKYKCCNLWKKHNDPVCDLSTCISQLYWVCPWEEDGEELLYRCVECYKTKHNLPDTVTMGCHIVSDIHVKCSKGVHPDDSDALILE